MSAIRTLMIPTASIRAIVASRTSAAAWRHALAGQIRSINQRAAIVAMRSRCSEPTTYREAIAGQSCDRRWEGMHDEADHVRPVARLPCPATSRGLLRRNSATRRRKDSVPRPIPLANKRFRCHWPWPGRTPAAVAPGSGLRRTGPAPAELRLLTRHGHRAGRRRTGLAAGPDHCTAGPTCPAAASGILYDADQLVRETDIVVVAVSYRVGAPSAICEPPAYRPATSLGCSIRSPHWSGYTTTSQSSAERPVPGDGRRPVRRRAIRRRDARDRAH